MPASCVIPDCNLKYTHSEDVSFHKFPFKFPDLLKQWIDFTGRDESWFPTKWSAVCSRHFVGHDFKDCAFRKMLLATAVPSVRKLEDKVERVDAYVPAATDEGTSGRDEDYLRGEELYVGASVTNFPAPCPIDDELQADCGDIPLIEITCRICGIVVNRTAAVNTLFDLAQSMAIVAKYLPFVNLELPEFPRKICQNCSKVVNGFAKFCDNVLRAQTELELRFVRATVDQSPIVPADGTTLSQQSAQTSADEPLQVASKPMNIKQEPIAMPHIKEEKIESTMGAASRHCKESAAGEPVIIKNQSIGLTDPNSIILVNVESERSNGSMSPSLNVKPQQQQQQQQPQQVRDASSKNCEILEIVNLYPPIVDITSATITEVQPCEVTIPPAVPPTAMAMSLPPPVASTVPQHPHFMGGLKVEKMTEVEGGEHGDDTYYLRDTLAFINTLEEHSYTKLPIQAEADNKDDVFHAVVSGASDGATWPGGSVVLGIGEQQKSAPIVVNGFGGWPCPLATGCGRRCSTRRRLLRHRALECPARRKLAVGCQFCRQRFPSWARARAHVSLCTKRSTTRHKRGTGQRKSTGKSRTVVASTVGEKSLSSGQECQEGEVVLTRYTCSMCDRSYSNTSNLRRHLVTHRPPEQWNHKCGICYKIFDKLFDLKRHLQISSCANGSQLLRQFAPLVPPDGFSDAVISAASATIISTATKPCIETTTTTTTDRLLYVCSTCNKHFRSYNNLKVHEPIHTGTKAYICETCGKRFSGQTNLWQHRLTHSELRQFRCKLCPKLFKRRGGLTQHVRAFHMKIKPYRCTTCGYEYALKADMTRCRHSKLKELEAC